MSSERVLIQEYDTAEDARAAEELLLESGANSDMVFRSGKRLRVISSYEGRAREALGFATPLAADTGDRGVAGSAADTAQGAASSVADSAQQAAGAAVDKVQDATDAVTDQVSTVTSSMADQVRSLSDTVRQKGASPDAPGVQRTVAQTTSNTLDKLSQYLRQPEPRVIIEDLRGAMRRNPTRSLLAGLGLGYLLRGRFFPAGGAQGHAGDSPASESPASGADRSGSLGAEAGYPDTLAGDTAPSLDVLVVDVDPATGEAARVTSTTLDDDAPGTTGTDDPRYPRTGV